MKILKVLLISVIATMSVSCGNVTEEIYLNEDGSGEYGLYYDMIPAAVDMSMQMAVMFGKVDSTNHQQMDSLETAVLNKVWKDFPDKVDSVIDLAEGVPDSLLNYGNNRQYVEKTHGYMRGSREEGSIYMGMKYPFKGTTELNGYLDFVNRSQQAKSAGRRGVSVSGINSTKTDATYTYSKNKFARKVKISNPQDPKEKSFALLKNMMDDATYTTIIYTPKNVQKVKTKGQYSIEGKKVILTYKLLDILTGDADMDFQITLED